MVVEKQLIFEKSFEGEYYGRTLYIPKEKPVNVFYGEYKYHLLVDLEAINSSLGPPYPPTYGLFIIFLNEHNIKYRELTFVDIWEMKRNETSFSS